MSWMDWGSRPKKSSAVPPPFYLTAGGEDTPYCHTCGRVIGTRKSTTKSTTKTAPKHCSERCKRNKPSTSPTSTDVAIITTFLALLDGHPPPTAPSTTDADQENKPNPLPKISAKKGETRILVPCTTIEDLVFARIKDPTKVYGRRKNRHRRGIHEDEWRSVDMVSPHASSSGETSSSESEAEGDGDRASYSDTEGAVPRADEAVGDDDAKRREGQKKAEEREMVRCAARRLCVFGVPVENPAVGQESAKGKKGKGKGRRKKDEVSSSEEEAVPVTIMRKCEAVMGGAVVEPSFAKGEWAIRWREE